jgi:hypothetical protein
VARFERWQLACKISDKQVENRILEAIPNSVADQIVVSLVGNEDKAALMEKIKGVMVKKRSTFFILIRLPQADSNSWRVAREVRGAHPPVSSAMPVCDGFGDS